MMNSRRRLSLFLPTSPARAGYELLTFYFEYGHGIGADAAGEGAMLAYNAAPVRRRHAGADQDIASLSRRSAHFIDWPPPPTIPPIF